MALANASRIKPYLDVSELSFINRASLAPVRIGLPKIKRPRLNQGFETKAASSPSIRPLTNCIGSFSRKMTPANASHRPIKTQEAPIITKYTNAKVNSSIWRVLLPGGITKFWQASHPRAVPFNTGIGTSRLTRLPFQLDELKHGQSFNPAASEPSTAQKKFRPLHHRTDPPERGVLRLDQKFNPTAFDASGT